MKPEHIIVVMLENRSFDHMLGYVPGIGDLTGTEFNLDRTSNQVYVNQLSDPPNIQPDHSFSGAMTQIFGSNAPSGSPTMSGFVASYETIDPADGGAVMACRDPASLPILATLATEFCCCTRWFSSVPGPTWPNRFFIHAGTSGGLIDNQRLGANVPTIYDKLHDAGISWCVYAGDVPQCLAMESMWKWLAQQPLEDQGHRHLKHFSEFRMDVEHAALPQYAFIEPRYFAIGQWEPTDEHPPHDVGKGDSLLAYIYANLAQSPLWEKSLLVITYDEHGGFYDKEPPPATAPPDALTSRFGFDRLGARVPAVLVSPYIPKGTVDNTPYDHTSVLATARDAFGLGSAGVLGNRDAAALSLIPHLSLNEPRKVTQLPNIDAPDDLAFEPKQDLKTMLMAWSAWKARIVETSLNDHQQDLLNLARTVNQNLL